MFFWFKYLSFMLSRPSLWNLHETGRSRLWGWFGLSRASFLVLPRVMMHEMPDAWQGKMADLLREYHETFPGMADYKYFVSIRGPKGFISLPTWLCNYRHPDKSMIDNCRDHDFREIQSYIPDV